MNIWPFNRKDNNQDKSDLPQEVQEYYQSERRERTGLAWLLAAGTLVGTILIATALFFGGRWTYRQIAGNNGSNETSEQANQPSSQEETADSNSSPQEADDQPAPATTQSPPATSSPAPPTTGDSALPRTGPEGDELL